MPRKTVNSKRCAVCGQRREPGDVVPASAVGDGVAALIKRDCPTWTEEDGICKEDLNRYRAAYVQQIIERGKGELSGLEQEVVKSLREEEILSRDVNADFVRRLTFGERAADRVAAFGGSWRFVGIFGLVLFLWVAINSIVLLWRPFDPYPFIFLNLILSCLAAIQAPIIMMSQNRQEARDRMHSEQDYRVNLKAEIEIRSLHEKMDHFLMHQWQRLLEIQKVQTQILEELSRPERPGRRK